MKASRVPTLVVLAVSLLGVLVRSLPKKDHGVVSEFFVSGVYYGQLNEATAAVAPVLPWQ